MPEQPDTATPARSSVWAAFRYRAFTVLWTASVIASIGTWMYTAACGWLMTALSPSPLVVALVQVATNLPMCLFAVPAGALTDIVDRRKLLLIGESTTTVLSAMFAGAVAIGMVSPWTVLIFMFLIGAGSALAAPGWQAIVPALVPKEELSPAIVATSVGINVSRAVGPALGGALTVASGVILPLWINAVSNLATVGGLLWWRGPRTAKTAIPAERFWRAIAVGWRHTVHNHPLRATLIRSVAFIVFASAYWALLPLVARTQVGGGPATYGVLLGCIGAASVAGGAALPRLRGMLGPERLMTAAAVVTAVALVLFAVARGIGVALTASLCAGFSWIAALSTLNASAQVALPDWVRGRGLAYFVTAMFGAMSLGSVVWGQAAVVFGLPVAHFAAAIGALLAIPLTRRWKVLTAAGVDLTPALSWPAPVTAAPIELARGPVLVTVEYRIDPKKRQPFLDAIHRLAGERRRDGASDWGVFEDTAQRGRFLETFLVASWVEHLRQHERATRADVAIQVLVDRFHAGGAPIVTHYVAAEPEDEPDNDGEPT